MTKYHTAADRRENPEKTLKEVNAINKDRAKRMEAAISRIFVGDTRGRVAYSGAGIEKGDNKIPLPNSGGNLYIECKLSAYRHKGYGPGIRTAHVWFWLMEINKKKMGSRFAVLATHYHNIKGYFIFFREVDIPIIESISGNKYYFDGPVIDKRYLKNGKKTVSPMVYRNEILAGMESSSGSVKHVKYNSILGVEGENPATYIVVDVYDFKKLCGYPDKPSQNDL